MDGWLCGDCKFRTKGFKVAMEASKQTLHGRPVLTPAKSLDSARATLKEHDTMIQWSRAVPDFSFLVRDVQERHGALAFQSLHFQKRCTFASAIIAEHTCEQIPAQKVDNRATICSLATFVVDLAQPLPKKRNRATVPHKGKDLSR